MYMWKMHLQIESTLIYLSFCPSRLILHLVSSYIIPLIDYLRNLKLRIMTCREMPFRTFTKKGMSFLCCWCFPQHFRRFLCITCWYWETAMWYYLIRDVQWPSYQKNLFGLWHIDRINTQPTKSFSRSIIRHQINFLTYSIVIWKYSKYIIKMRKSF